MPEARLNRDFGREALQCFSDHFRIGGDYHQERSRRSTNVSFAVFPSLKSADRNAEYVGKILLSMPQVLANGSHLARTKALLGSLGRHAAVSAKGTTITLTMIFNAHG